MGFFSQAFLIFLMKESKKRRRKQPGKLMAKSCSQSVNLPSARPLMNPLHISSQTRKVIETPGASHVTPHFWCNMHMKTLQARQVNQPLQDLHTNALQPKTL